MSSVPDPAKLKVVELRAELSARGLDAKGNKAVLVKRLKDALGKELKTELPDTSIADTSTEDINTSQTEDEASKKKDDAKGDTESMDDTKKEPMDISSEKVVEKIPDEVEEVPKSESIEPKSEEAFDPVGKIEDEKRKQEENGEQQDNTEEPPSKKGRFEVTVEDNEESKESEDQQGGEKRKHSTDVQKVRPKTPVKDDEPSIDVDKVQLNWYDSDLHLQIDKERFLKAKPYHDGIFGYVWAGVRATHGASKGKVCFEMKISEELKWEDVIKQPEKGSRDRDRRDSRRDKPKSSTKSVPEERKTKANTENGSEEKSNEEQSRKNVVTEEKMDTTEIDESKTEIKEEEEESSKSEEIIPKERSKVDETSKNVDGERNKKESITGEKVESKKEEKEQNKREEQIETDEKKESEVVDEIKIPPHLIRIGWSTSFESLQLGETKYSYGFESSGKFVSNNEFTEYGKAFGVGDVIGTFLAFCDECVNLIYTINGEELPLAVSIPRTKLPEGEFSLFPHILSKNYAFEVNFGSLKEPFCKIPEKLSEFKFIDAVEDKIIGPQRPEARSECEVIMMIGLPASGKTHWVNEYLEKNRDKKYTVIGNTQLLEKMTVDGTPFRNSVKPYWNSLLDKLTKTSNKLVDVASSRRRNIVIDQTNECDYTQRRKMRQFDGYKRRAIVVVCGDEEQTKRKAQYEEQQETKLSNAYICQMKANISLPRVCDWVEEVTYVELKEEEAKAMVQKYNKEARDAGYYGTGPRREARNNKFNKWQDNRRNDYHRSFRSKYPPPRFDRGHKQQDYRSQRWVQNERRNSRDPPRDWRSQRGSGPRLQERSRDRHTRPGSRDSYNRNRNQGGRNWQGGGSNWNQGGWNQGGNSQWNSGSWGGNSSNWNSGHGGGKWNYNHGGGYGQQGYGNSNYSGWSGYQGQNWNPNYGSNHSMSGNGH